VRPGVSCRPADGAQRGREGRVEGQGGDLDVVVVGIVVRASKAC
jgi:hypothetical protein